MHTIEAFSNIATIAKCRSLQIDGMIKSNPTAFPKGSDEVLLFQELSICQAVIELCRGQIASRFMILSFSEGGEAEVKYPQEA